jgi:hypothetical protein
LAMSFKRRHFPSNYPTGFDLTLRLVSIGFRFSENPSKVEPNIEETLVACSIEGVRGDFRALSLLTDWFDTHSERVNADHLIKLVSALDDSLIKKYWIACAQWKKSDSRFKKLREMDDGNRVRLDQSKSDFLLKRDGEDSRFISTTLIVAAKHLRHRPADIDPPEKLSKFHRGYYYRLLIGPTYRADILALLEKNPKLTAAELARLSYSSFSTAWQVRNDFEIINKAS